MRKTVKMPELQFLVSPASTPKLLQAMLDTGLALAPGVSTSSEVAMAQEMGLTELKLFPGPSQWRAPPC